jgi:hypothetical protein
MSLPRSSLSPHADDKFGDAFGFTYEEFSDVTLGVDPNVSVGKFGVLTEP